MFDDMVPGYGGHIIKDEGCVKGVAVRDNSYDYYENKME